MNKCCKELQKKLGAIFHQYKEYKHSTIWLIYHMERIMQEQTKVSR